MSLLRAFVAIEIPNEIKKEIAGQTAGLQRAIAQSVRWVAPENLHLTLKFLGDISSTNLGVLTQALETEASQQAPFQITVGSLGAFPNMHRPRVIWIGLEAPPGLGKLQHSIDAATNRLGYSSDDKPFSGHLTIGRVRQQSSSAEMAGLRSALEKTKVGLMGTFSAKSVHLFRSDLQPDGPIYTCLFTAALGGRPFTR